jgi:hypothetical protein
VKDGCEPPGDLIRDHLAEQERLRREAWEPKIVGTCTVVRYEPAVRAVAGRVTHGKVLKTCDGDIVRTAVHHPYGPNDRIGVPRPELPAGYVFQCARCNLLYVAAPGT